MCIKAGAKVRKKILSTKYFPKNLMSEQGVCQCPSNYGPHPLISCSCLTCLSLVPRLLIARAPLAYRSCLACLSLVPRLLIARAPLAYRLCPTCLSLVPRAVRGCALCYFTTTLIWFITFVDTKRLQAFCRLQPFRYGRCGMTYSTFIK